ncbi:hypothetical protein BC939DRAFT_464241 [Gamsiella multidivaricata]|uniref:uncharacterized protein n=1 Tax=Gamsiella multidivaricata TaxID=101098 RepID=UPI00221F0A63|nr:uncharacterized protein BC939DRAFT_464241 [Gamsiella multidivaricata]KAI7817959.1 hypothetical protein BC939DRAFT_464241 [Gamsiella multidivaricata]
MLLIWSLLLLLLMLIHRRVFSSQRRLLMRMMASAKEWSLMLIKGPSSSKNNGCCPKCDKSLRVAICAKLPVARSLRLLFRCRLSGARPAAELIAVQASDRDVMKREK